MQQLALVTEDIFNFAAEIYFVLLYFVLLL